jgi:hypothetical protein
MKFVSTTCLMLFVCVGYFGMTSFKPATKSSTLFDNEYDAQFISTQQTGANYEWVWSVSNPNYGNGLNGTMQNLSHWSLAISDMITINDIVSVAYSLDGINWTSLPVSFAIDKSQECYLGTVLKFDYGTSGTAPTYYKLVVNRDLPTGYSTTNFKSGQRTGCYNGTVLGIGTPIDDGTEK